MLPWIRGTSSNLTVASLDPDMITFSSYWRQRTEPVWPCSTWIHSRLSRSHIYITTFSTHPLWLPHISKTTLDTLLGVWQW